jgi:hypothetical protein
VVATPDPALTQTMELAMIRAKSDFTLSRAIPLSSLFTDPLVAAAFRRAEEDDSLTFAVPSRPRTLDGGAAEVVRELEFA